MIKFYIETCKNVLYLWGILTSHKYWHKGMLRHAFGLLVGIKYLREIMIWLNIVGSPWKEGEIRLEVDKTFFENPSLNPCCNYLSSLCETFYISGWVCYIFIFSNLHQFVNIVLFPGATLPDGSQMTSLNLFTPNSFPIANLFKDLTVATLQWLQVNRPIKYL